MVACASLSITHGPAIKTSGALPPMVTLPISKLRDGSIPELCPSPVARSRATSSGLKTRATFFRGNSVFGFAPLFNVDLPAARRCETLSKLWRLEGVAIICFQWLTAVFVRHTVTINNARMGDGKARDVEEVEEAKEVEEDNVGGRVARWVCRPPCAPFVVSKIITLERSTGEGALNCPMVQNQYRPKRQF